MEKEAVNTYFEQMYAEQIKKLTDVGFTEEQAKVLLEMMPYKTPYGGLV